MSVASRQGRERKREGARVRSYATSATNFGHANCLAFGLVRTSAARGDASVTCVHRSVVVGLSRASMARCASIQYIGQKRDERLNHY